MLRSGAGNKSGCFWYIAGIYSQEKWMRLPRGKVRVDWEEKSGQDPAPKNLRKNLKWKEEHISRSDYLYFVILATQRSLMIIARVMLEECRARSQIEVDLRNGKGGREDGLYTLFISMCVSP